MSFFTDKEHRILLSALRRERQVCEAIDRQYMHEPYDVLLTDICKSIEKKVHDIQHKYRWHDLRKDPDDLPTECKPVLLSTLGGANVVAYAVTTEGHSFPRGWYMDAPYESPLCDISSYYAVAWREIEPFEESDNGT